MASTSPSLIKRPEPPVRLLRTLVIDGATRSGWAYYEQGVLKKYGSCTIDRAQHVSAECNAQVLVYELNNYPKNSAITWHQGMICGRWIECNRLTHTVALNPNQWRSAAYGTVPKKRSECKKYAMKWCENKGISVANDDEAEAIIMGTVWHLFTDFGG